MDERIKRVKTNSRFRKTKSHKVLTVLDGRFKSLINNQHFVSKKSVDKRGRIFRKKNELHQLYKNSFNDEVPENDELSSEDEKSSDSCYESIEANFDIDISQDLVDHNTIVSETIATTKLAAINMDWDKVDAADIFVFLSTFCSKSEIKYVKIFISKLGSEALKVEENNGPSFDSSDQDDQDDLDKIQSLKLKKYYLKRRQYYFAIIEFVNTDLALKVYQAADGLEVEDSSLNFNLSFVPEDMEFSEELVSECTDYPLDFTPHSFVLKALQQTNFDFEWDETDSRRLEITHKKAFTIDDLANPEKYDDLLAPPSDDDNMNKYTELFKDSQSSSSDREDLCVSWTGKLDPEDQPTAQEYKQHYEPPSRKSNFKDPFLTTIPQHVTKLPCEIIQPKPSSISEYELLTLDSNNSEQHHFDYHQEVTREKGSFKKRVKETFKNKKHISEFQVNLADNRFSAMFQSPLFAIDPTSTQFKQTQNMQTLLQQQTSKRKKPYETDD